MVEIALLIIFSVLLGVGLFASGFWLGFSFLKRQMPDLPLPDVQVKVDNHNHIKLPDRPAVLSNRTPIEQKQDSTAEFIGDL